MSDAVSAVMTSLKAPLPWRADADGILFDARGEEVGYMVAVPDTATASTMAAIVALAVNSFGGIPPTVPAGDIEGHPV